MARTVRRPNPRRERALENIKKIGKGAYRSARKKAIPRTERIPRGRLGSEYRVREAERRKSRIRAERSVNRKLQKSIEQDVMKVIGERSKSDHRISNLVSKARTGKMSPMELKIFDEIIARTTSEVMEKRGIPIQQ